MNGKELSGSEIVSRFDSLWAVRKTLDTVFQEIEHFCSPFRGEFFRELHTETEVDWHRSNIYDSTALHAAELLAAHIHGALTSPGVKWFSLKFRDEAMAEQEGAKEWLEECENIVWKTLTTESDFNTEIAEVYTDLVVFGTSIIMQEPVNGLEWEGYDFTAWPIQDCYFELGPDQKPWRVYRKIRYTKFQFEEKFPNFTVDDQDATDVDTKTDVIFCVYYRPDHADIDISKPLKPELRPVGYKYVKKSSGEELEEGGYFEFPAMTPRWRKTAGAVWGNSPAMKMIADIRMLNETVAQTTEATAKEIDPPMKTTTRGILGDLDVDPGGLTVVQEMDDLDRLFPPGRIDWGVIEKERLQEQIRNGFFLNALTLKESPAMTATEVIERRQEMTRFMGPTSGRLQNDLLNPLIENTFIGLHRMGQLPEMPESIEGVNLDVVYVGSLPRAEKLEEAASIQMWMGENMAMAEFFPQALDNIDIDAVVRTQAEARGVPTKLLLNVSEVEALRQQRQEMEQQAQQMAMMQGAGDAMKSVGEGNQALKAVE